MAAAAFFLISSLVFLGNVSQWAACQGLLLVEAAAHLSPVGKKVEIVRDKEAR
jgi:hypothetical protein